MSARINHAECNHPSTKVARAKCRRELAKLVTTVVAVASVVADSPIITAWKSMKSGPLELTAAPVAGEFDLIGITRQTWREFKGQTVDVSLTKIEGDERTEIRGEITGWSENLIQIKADKLNRVSADRVVNVYTAPVI